jgi:hypothetical protein
MHHSVIHHHQWYHSLEQQRGALTESEEEDPEKKALIVHVGDQASINSDRLSQQSLIPTDAQQQSEQHRRKRHCITSLYLVDILLSIVFFSPLVSLYWYCTWLFLNDYFITCDAVLSNALSYALGLLILLPAYVLQENLQQFYNRLGQLGPVSSSVSKFLMRTVYIYLMSFAVVLEWRGLWNLCDIYIFKDWRSQLSLSIIALSFFYFTRGTRTLVSTPFIVFTDDYNYFFVADSRYKLRSVSLIKSIFNICSNFFKIRLSLFVSINLIFFYYIIRI